MYVGNVEPSLEELLSDPVTLLMMACDGLEADHVRACLKAAQLNVRTAEEAGPRAGDNKSPAGAGLSSGRHQTREK